MSKFCKSSSPAGPKAALNKKTLLKSCLLVGVAALLLSAAANNVQAASVSKTDADAVGGIITVTGAELNVGTATLPSGGGSIPSGKGGVDVRASGGNSIVIEGGSANIITSGGVRTYGVYAGVTAGGTGDITIGSASNPLSGVIKTTDTGNNSFSFGLTVNNEGTGKISVYNDADIDTYGRGGRGIMVYSTNAAGGDIIIENSGNITMHHANNPFASIQVEDKGAGNIYVTSSGDMIGQNVAGNENGFYIHKDIDTTGNINIGYSGNGQIKAVTGTITTLGDGWQVFGWHRGAGDINVQVGQGTLKNGIDAATADSTIMAHYNPGAAVVTKRSNIFINVDKAYVENNGTGDSAAIEARHDGTLGTINIYSKATVVTKGDDAAGIMARYTAAIQNGKIVVNNAGNITANGSQSRGIRAYVGQAAGVADILVENSGRITTHGNGNSHAIVAENNGIGNATVLANGAHLRTSGTGVNNHGIEAKAENGDSTIIFSNGHVDIGKSGSAGLAAYQSPAGASATAKAKVEVRNSVIDASKSYGQHGVSAFAQGGGQIYIDANTKVHGGWSNGALIASGVAIGGADQRLKNHGSI